MADYIRRTLAKAQFTGNFQSEYPTALIHALLDGVPSEDVRPVVRGRWIDTDNYYQRRKCSVCGCHTRDACGCHTRNAEPSFCPNCGADMRD